MGSVQARKSPQKGAVHRNRSEGTRINGGQGSISVPQKGSGGGSDVLVDNMGGNSVVEGVGSVVGDDGGVGVDDRGGTNDGVTGVSEASVGEDGGLSDCTDHGGG